MWAQGFFSFGSYYFEFLNQKMMASSCEIVLELNQLYSVQKYGA